MLVFACEEARFVVNSLLIFLEAKLRSLLMDIREITQPKICEAAHP
jgi:hypothetical protein